MGLFNKDPKEKEAAAPMEVTAPPLFPDASAPPKADHLPTAEAPVGNCPSCTHPKHTGGVCGLEIGTRINNEGLTEPVRCSCSDAQARKADKGKVGGFHLLPWSVLTGLAAIYDYGRKKYAANSWQEVPPDGEGRTAEERYEDAMFRHFGAFKEGKWLDPESKLPHLYHALWGMVALCWFNDKKRKETK